MMNNYTKLAIKAARGGGAIIARDFGKRPVMHLKDRINPVTETDLEAEQTIVSIIRRAFPSHSILAEEKEQAPRTSEYLWIVDPLDGTTNFSHGYPVVAVSIALLRGDELLLGVVWDPLRRDMFTAEKRKGATLNGDPIRVSDISSMEASLLCTGFPYSIKENRGDNFDNFERFSVRAQGVRRDGSAALDLCYVAAGRFDGFWERTLKPWDTAASIIMLREAGGSATDYAGNEYNPFLDELVASNGIIHDEMLRVIRPD